MELPSEAETHNPPSTDEDEPLKYIDAQDESFDKNQSLSIKDLKEGGNWAICALLS